MSKQIFNKEEAKQLNDKNYEQQAEKQQSVKQSQLREPQRPQQVKEIDVYDELGLKIKQFQQSLAKREKVKAERQGKTVENLQSLHETMEQKTTRFLYKLEELKRKETIVLTLGKIEPETPQTFPKNYYMQVIYQDVNLSGNQKFIDFDENIIDEKFVLPLLGSTKVKVEVMVADQNQQQSPSIFDKTEIDLQTEIQAALKKQKHESSVDFQNNPGTSVSFSIVLQGVGFNSWLKGIHAHRQLKEERELKYQLNNAKIQKNIEKQAQKRERFNKAFKTSDRKPKATTKYQLNEMNSILNLLKDE